MSDNIQRGGRGQYRGNPRRGAGSRGRASPMGTGGQSQGSGRSDESRGGSPGSERGRGFDRGRGGSGFDRGRGGPGFDRGGGGPGFDRGRGGAGFDRGRGGAGFDRGRGGRGFDGGAGFDRGRGGRGFDGGRGGRGFDRGRGGFSGSVIYAESIPAVLPDRLADDTQEKLIASFKSLNVQPDRPLRPGFGTLGNPITLRANFFPVRVPKGPIYDYKVEISPKTDINKVKSRIFELLELSPLCQPHLPYIAHDRDKRIVSGRKLPQPLDIEVSFYEDDESGPSTVSYNVSIKFFREIDTQQLTRYLNAEAESREFDIIPVISALNLVLQQDASRKGIRVGNSRYFYPTEGTDSLGPRIDVWKGFFLSVRPTFKQLMLNVNVCMTAFVKPGNLAGRLLQLQDSTGALPTLSEEMRNSIKVRTQHLGHKKRIKAIGTTSARNTYFDCEQFGGRISVEQYFFKAYNRKLRYPVELPVIDIGSNKKASWVPAELCDIEEGNAYRGRLDGNETAQMIKHACKPPGVNAEAIVGRGLPILAISPAQEPLAGFNVSIDPTMAVVPGRELLHPTVKYKAGRADVKNGSWNILGVKFQQGATITSWWVMVVRDGHNMLSGPKDPRLMGLVQGFATKLKNSGVNIPTGLPHLIPPPTLPPPHSDPSRTLGLRNIKSTLEGELKTQKKPSFVLVLLENRDNYIYPGIKRICDVELGIHTVHMQLGKALTDERKQDQYFSNVALKVNTKLGGMNHLLEPNAMNWLTKKRTMMVGIDVTHRGPGSRDGTPSIAAVVANVDDNFVQFPASLRIQQHSSLKPKEMLDELRAMLIERLNLYEKRNKVLPDRIFVYRDGVSEGQFDTVLKEELPQVLEAFKAFGTKTRRSYRPSLSIIICGKRHHARFYPTDSKYADRNGNTRPGTVVDKGVTGVFDFDFYLQAHAGIQGSVKATHYIVVYDENGLTADDIQQGTHSASYLYARATKAVSLIPAAYYADLACERGRCYLNDFLVGHKPSSVRKSPEEKKKEADRVFELAKKAWGQGLHEGMRDSMFYI